MPKNSMDGFWSHKHQKDREREQGRKLIAIYLTRKRDPEFLRYLIDELYDDMVPVCSECEAGLVLEQLRGDYAWGQCDNCHKNFTYRN